MLPMLIKVKQRVVGSASSVFASVCTTLLCWFVLKLFMCLLVHNDSRWSLEACAILLGCA